MIINGSIIPLMNLFMSVKLFSCALQPVAPITVSLRYGSLKHNRVLLIMQHLLLPIGSDDNHECYW